MKNILSTIFIMFGMLFVFNYAHAYESVDECVKDGNSFSKCWHGQTGPEGSGAEGEDMGGGSGGTGGSDGDGGVGP